ncbi:Bug family tripartite tricarboxylate transporter substrate binding protein [Ottowia thiooxydans]|uniref:Tripartite-type tricarboxylate transporter receptor subunit TctC n=1 Tax=Ottowia thiooxydans TaxID=219182 RepID=A0ABV2Q2Y6_9BURK
MNFRHAIWAACSASALLVPLITHAADDATYPTKPITLIVPFPAGGVIDATARMVAERLQAQMKSSVLVDNRPGAGGTIGTALAARAPADGYTFLVGDAATQVYSPAIFKNAKYDPIKSFASIGQISYGPLVMLAGQRSQSKSATELMEELRRGVDKIDYASNGNGSTPHLATEMFKKVTGIKSSHIPFNGGPAAMTALAGGDVTYSINHIPLALSIIATGRVKPVAVTGAKRSPVFPDLPTLTEIGIKGYEAYSWIGLFAQAGMPEHIQKRMSAELKAALQDPELQKKMEKLGDVPFYQTPAELNRYIASETARWVPLIRSSGISLD